MFTPLLFLLVMSAPQSAPPGPVLSPDGYYRLLLKARADFDKNDFRTAAEEFAALAAQNAAAGETWLSLGNCYYELHEPAKAIEPYKKAFDLGHSNIENVAYNIGCCYALSGDKESAFQWLDKSLALRFEGRPGMPQDADLASLHDDPRWIKVAGLAPDKNASRDEKWRYDIDYLISEMKRMHYRWGVEGLPADILSGAESLKSRLPQISDTQILVEIQKLMVMLGDGHSSVKPLLPNNAVMRLPLRFYKFDEGMFIIDSERAGLVGSKVIAIGGKPVEEIWSKMGNYISRDNDQGLVWNGPNYMSFLGVLKDAGASVGEKDVRLTLMGRDGKQSEVDVEAKPAVDRGHAMYMRAPGDPATAPMYLRKTDDFYWFQDLPEAKAVYFQYNAVGNKKDESVSAFAGRLSKHLADSTAENLIVDVRHNSGGNSFLNLPLIRAFIVFEDQKKGRIFLITGRNTFSAAQNFVNDVNRETHAVFVGEPSSSRPFFVGESARFVLPYSQVAGTISTRLHTVNSFDRRVWIAPDIPVPVTAADFFANRDAALDAILAVIKEGT